MVERIWCLRPARAESVSQLCCIFLVVTEYFQINDEQVKQTKENGK